MKLFRKIVLGLIPLALSQVLFLQTATAQSTATPAVAPSTAAVIPTSPRYLSANCANCHGTNGNAVAGFVLAGLKKDYIIEQMAAFKSGKRPATIMHQIAKGYSDAQIVSMAEYFSQQTATK